MLIGCNFILLWALKVIGLVTKMQATARLFTIGLGDDVSTSLLWGVARAGRGTSTFIRDKYVDALLRVLFGTHLMLATPRQIPINFHVAPYLHTSHSLEN